MKKRRLIGLLTASVLAMTSVPVLSADAGQEQRTGSKDGYDWEVWNQYGQGSESFEIGSNGTYSCSWSGIHNILFRAGRHFDHTPWAQNNGITVEFEASTYQPNGNSYLCVYGWTVDPIVEYYIVENYGNWRPPGNDGMTKCGTIQANGGTYEVYKGIHNGPSIDPNVNSFNQYWSVRVDSDLRNSGVISVSDHFAAWEGQYGMKMGGLHEVALNVEGWQSSGRAVISKNNVILGPYDGETGSTTTPTEPEEEINVTPVSGKGSGVTDDFEGSGTDWTARGDDETVGFTSDFKHGGSKSLYVSGRKQAWQGFTVKSDELKAGGSYSFEGYTAFKSKNYSSMGFTLGLQYDLDGKTNYDDLTKDNNASPDEWVKLASDFEIKSGATNISLYIQSTYTENPKASDLIPFFLDDVKLTNKSAPPVETTVYVPPTPVETTTEYVPPTPVETTVSEPPVQTTEPEPVIITLAGDVDCNGDINIADAIMLARFNAEDTEVFVTTAGKANANVDGDNKIGSEDLTMILEYLAGIRQKL